MSLVLAGALKNKAAAQPGAGVEVTYQDFYDDLSPYGQWIDYPDQGYVWVPNEGPDFRPYDTKGHWVWSDDYEWMWVSDYSWGWAPFHYGRWLEDPYYGWMWVPGYEWAPAWVAWRDGGDYYGWAPLRPGINISVGFSFGSYNPPINDWCFAPRRYISSPRIYDYCVPRHQNITIINNTTIINNYSRRTNNIFVTGPRRRDAERYAGRINPVRFRESNGPGRSSSRRNEVSFYRPNIQRNNNRAAAPRSFEHYDRNRQDNRDALHRNTSRKDNRDALHRNNDRQDNGNVLSRRNSDNRPNTNDNNITDRRRNALDRNNNNNNGQPANPQGDRGRSNNPRPATPQGNDQRIRRNADNSDSRNRNAFDRNNNQPANPVRPSEGERPAQRRNAFDRNSTPSAPARPIERRASEPRPQSDQRMNRGNGGNDFQRRNAAAPRQSSPQMQRQPSQPQRQPENRGGGERRGGGGGGDRRGGGRGH